MVDVLVTHSHHQHGEEPTTGFSLLMEFAPGDRIRIYNLPIAAASEPESYELLRERMKLVGIALIEAAESGRPIIWNSLASKLVATAR